MSSVSTPAKPDAYCIWIVSPPGYLHSRCFEELALSLSEAFAELGFAAPIVTDPGQARGVAIVLGANLLKSWPGPLPERMVLYNLEQVHLGSTWFDQSYLDILSRHPVWDYSALNVTALARLGIEATLCGVGYSPGLTRIPHAFAQDIDVAFVGSLNPRRSQALQAMRNARLNVHAAVGVYGAERDALFARAKMVLNLHYHEAQVFEIVRVSYLLANRLCVVSEVGLDRALEDPFARGVAFAPYGELVAACRFLVQRQDARRRIANAGYEAFRAMPQAPLLKAALDRLETRTP
jgi:hypothetical protein